jgi:hypothetical protein
MTPKTLAMKEITIILESIKMESFCSVENTIKRMRIQTTDWKKNIVKKQI